MSDVSVQTIIHKPVAEVAAYAGNPDNAPIWYVNIKRVEWVTDPPLQLGSKVAFVAHFLGRRMAYTYEIIELEPNQKLVMRTSQGPFPMETTYTWQTTDAGHTQMTLRNHGEPGGFFKLLAPIMAKAMHRAMTADLAQLKQLMEAEPAGFEP